MKTMGAEIMRVVMGKTRLIGGRHYDEGDVIEVDDALARDIVERGDGRILRQGETVDTAADPSHDGASKAAVFHTSSNGRRPRPADVAKAKAEAAKAKAEAAKAEADASDGE